ncbi:MAG TPA: GDP-mannose 4,6-dehydratase [Allosphingosinicella sp.]|jgi:GDP-4-dehydro-6-deoxy-D-mannose reductase
MKVLITGMTGFAGTHLAAYARGQGAEVSGLSRSTGVDLGDVAALGRAVGDARPDLIFHLAAQTSGSDEAQLHRSNVEGTRNLLESAAALGTKPRVLVASSSAIYGGGPAEGEPISEDAPLTPNGAYAAAKAGQDRLAEQLGRDLALDVVRARAFNQTGPGERDSFVASSVARQIAEIEAGLRAPRIAIGRTDTLRDFSDVRDIARGYWLAATRGEAGEAYNLCSGRAVSIRQILDILLSLSSATVAVEQDPARMRPSDVPVQVGDPSRAQRELGWEATIPLEQTLSDLLQYWRDAVRRV